jgi:hypothetical protein
MGFLDRRTKHQTGARVTAPSHCPERKVEVGFSQATFCPPCGMSLLRYPSCGCNWVLDTGVDHVCRICGERFHL